MTNKNLWIAGGVVLGLWWLFGGKKKSAATPSALPKDSPFFNSKQYYEDAAKYLEGKVPIGVFNNAWPSSSFAMKQKELPLFKAKNVIDEYSKARSKVVAGVGGWGYAYMIEVDEYGRGTQPWMSVWIDFNNPQPHGKELLPKDAKGWIDQYSKVIWRDPKKPGGQQETDEYGRSWHGASPSPWGSVLNVAQGALPYIPGIGTAAAAGLAFSLAIARGKSLQDAAIASARASLPPYAQVGFDMGVAVASGESVDSAAKQALMNQLGPEGQAAYNQGVAAYNKAKK